MKNKGFTLVELLIASTVISILVVVGVVIFVKVGQSARDVKKKADIGAISKAYEDKYLEAGSYQPALGSDFATGEIPVPLEGGTYGGLITSNSSTYRICAALEGNPEATCDAPSDTCYCRESQMEKYVGGGGGAPTPTQSPTPTPSLPSNYNATKMPGSVVNTAGYGLMAWMNPGNAVAEDAVFARVGFGGHGTSYSNYLDASNFGFAIPSGATITGIQVDIKKQNETLGTLIYDDKVALIKGGAMGAANKANSSSWPTSLAYSTYGGPGDLWGETWTPADINSSGFVARLSARSANVAYGLVDVFKVTIYYTN